MDFSRLITASLMTILLLNFPVRAFAYGWFDVPKKNEALLSLGSANDKDQTLNPQEIDLLVWNTYKSQNPSWRTDFSFLSLDKEIIVLQEAFLCDVVKETFENQNIFQYKMATSFIYTRSGIPTGTATGSTIFPTRFSFKKTRDVEIVGLTPKALLFTEYPMTGRSDTLLVVNIHALNSVPAIVLKRQLKDAAVEIRKHLGPAVFAGDFNTWSNRKLRVMHKMMESLGMTEVQFPNGNERMRSSFKGNFIDYIFIRGLSYSDPWVWGNLQGADHKALTVRLSVL
ncbi:MAG: hypothetical protein A2X86_08800 [Bdellovibrionales bacterium GWA2_49_15]|nr:MAG: hypothetical protein A2X86_08800 [Bdellovibrionales bacterium GWA2_49_15]HAZ12875.1 endonuclease/exonuclease/phosphatase family protein [Bdellovibrionales bacterium]